jgi:hypothetical protein
MRLYFYQQQQKSRAYFVKGVKNGCSIQNGGPKSNFLTALERYPTFFQSSFCIHLVLVRRKFCRKKVFQKIQDSGLNIFFRFSRHLGYS